MRNEDEMRSSARPGLRRRITVSMCIVAVVAAVLGVRIAAGPTVLEAYEPLSGVRLHVVPNSNSVADQQLKLSVRDALLPTVFDAVSETETSRDAAMRLLADKDDLIQLAQAELARHGAAYEVRVSARWDGAGEPTALRIVIGAGDGNNWFCVLVPPLCFGDLDAVEKEPADTNPREGGSIRIAWRWLGNLFGRSTLPIEGIGDVHEDDVDADLAHSPPRDRDVRAAGE